jgi:hypothetical protein
METIETYFAGAGTPAMNSPTGRLMVAVLAKFPALSFEEARAKANALLQQAAGKRVYRFPIVLTDEEEEARKASVRERFQTRHLLKAA